MQETRENITGCLDFFTIRSSIEIKSESVFILINNQRFSIERIIKQSKNTTIAMVEHNRMKKIFLVVSVYLNPTRSDANLKKQTKVSIKYWIT